MKDAGAGLDASFDDAAMLERNRSASDRHELLALLGRVLKGAGHARVVEAKTPEPLLWTPPTLSMLLLCWSLGGALGAGLGASWWAWPFFAAAVAAALILSAKVVPAFTEAIVVSAAVCWLIAGIGLAFDDWRAWQLAYGFPCGMVTAVGVVRTVLRQQPRDALVGLAGVARSAPFVVPVVLLAVLLPALSADVWQLAVDIRAVNVAAAAAVSVGVLLVLVSRQLAHELKPALSARCRILGAADRAELTRRALATELDGEDARRASEVPDALLEDAWTQRPEEYVPYLVAAEQETLRQPLFVRLTITTSAIGALLMLYIYVLLAVTVPASTAAAWSRSSIDSWPVGSLGVELSGGPYITIAVVLGVFATAIFLAFALTEERFSSALTSALLREPIDRFLVLAVPFVGLVEWAVACDGTPVAPVPVESDGDARSR